MLDRRRFVGRLAGMVGAGFLLSPETVVHQWERTPRRPLSAPPTGPRRVRLVCYDAQGCAAFTSDPFTFGPIERDGIGQPRIVNPSALVMERVPGPVLATTGMRFLTSYGIVDCATNRELVRGDLASRHWVGPTDTVRFPEGALALADESSQADLPFLRMFL
jgi:hypothetical protein